MWGKEGFREGREDRNMKGKTDESSFDYVAEFEASHIKQS